MSPPWMFPSLPSFHSDHRVPTLRFFVPIVPMDKVGAIREEPEDEVPPPVRLEDKPMHLSR